MESKTEEITLEQIYTDVQSQMESKIELAKMLDEQYPIKDGDYYVTFGESKHPAVKQIEKLSLRAADEFLIDLDLQIRGNRKTAERKAKEEGFDEQHLNDAPYYQAWAGVFPTVFAIYDAEGNSVYKGCFNIGDPEDRNLVEKYNEKYGLFAHMIQIDGRAFIYAKKQEEWIEKEIKNLNEEYDYYARNIGYYESTDVPPFEEQLDDEEFNLRQAQRKTASIKDLLKQDYEFKRICYGTEIPKELDLKESEKLIPIVTRAVTSDGKLRATNDHWGLETFDREKEVRIEIIEKEFNSERDSNYFPPYWEVKIEAKIQNNQWKQIYFGKTESEKERRVWQERVLKDIYHGYRAEELPHLEAKSNQKIISQKEEKIMEKEEIKNEVKEEKVVKEEQKMKNAEVKNEVEKKTIAEKYLEAQKSLVEKIEKYVDRTGDLPWNSDDFPKKVAQQNGEKAIALRYENQNPKRAAYTDFNQMVLSVAATEKGYKDNRWITRDYALKSGGYIKRGEHASKVFVTPKDDLTKDFTERRVQRFYNVFNVEQTSNVPMAKLQEEENRRNGIHLIDEVVAKNPKLQEQINENKTEKDQQAYATILHNLGRGETLNAEQALKSSKKLSEEEVRKEIVAEISSAFLKQSFSADISEKNRPGKMDPKLAVSYLKEHPDEMALLCKEAQMNRMNAINYLKDLNKELKKEITKKPEEQKVEENKTKTVAKKKAKDKDKGRER